MPHLAEPRSVLKAHSVVAGQPVEVSSWQPSVVASDGLIDQALPELAHTLGTGKLCSAVQTSQHKGQKVRGQTVEVHAHTDSSALACAGRCRMREQLLRCEVTFGLHRTTHRFEVSVVCGREVLHPYVGEHG